MTDITIPPAALEAALEAFAHASGLGILPDDECDEEWREDLQNGMRAACLAMLKAWPGMCHAHNENGVNVAWATWYALPWHRANASEGIILPFSENTDAEG